MTSPLGRSAPRLDDVVGLLRRRTLIAGALAAGGLGCQPQKRRASPGPGAGPAQAAGHGLRVRSAGETGAAPRAAVILLHGWGAPGDDLVPLADALAVPGVRFLFPEGPLPAPGGGRAWWPLDLGRRERERAAGREEALLAEVPPGLPEARARVSALVADAQASLGLPASRVAIGGFSQGAMLALDVALRTAPALAGVLCLSGTIVAEPEWRARLAAAGERRRVFLSHGRRDDVLPFRIAERLRDALVGAAAEVDWVPFPGGHEIPPPVTDGARSFLGRVLGVG